MVLALFDLLTMSTVTWADILSSPYELPICLGHYSQEEQTPLTSKLLKRQVSQRQWSPTAGWQTTERVSILYEMDLSK